MDIPTVVAYGYSTNLIICVVFEGVKQDLSNPIFLFLIFDFFFATNSYLPIRHVFFDDIILTSPPRWAGVCGSCVTRAWPATRW